MKNLRQFAFTVVAVLIFTSAALADPPSRVARLKYMSGQVSVQPGGVDEWVAATINRPMTTSDRVWTDKDSRAELHLGSSALRMNSETSITLSNISDNTVQVELHQGTLNLRVAQLYDGEIYEVDTPNLAFTITKSGDYRFDVDAVGDTTNIIVRKGEGEATGDGPSVRLRSREQAKFYEGKSLGHEIGEAPRYDGFDDWCRVRSEREDRAESARYVSRYMVGYEDLDGYGRWVSMPPYGPVWVPAHVAADWAPYRYGHWIWVEPWGWTWVDDAPWGFAPFHYGRWIHTRGYWGWCPGPVHVRPYYAPALVAWVGGSNWGVGISIGGGGGYGWFPLGWGEPYIPHYRVSRGYFQNVNVTNTRITNITYVTNNYYNNNTRNFNNIHYVNNRVPGALTVVRQDTIVNGRPVGRDKIIIRDRDWKDRDKAPIMAGPPVAPSRRSVLGEHAGGPAAAPPRRIVERPVVSRERAPARPAPWAERERDYARDPGRPLDRPRDERAGRPDDRGRPEVPGRAVPHPGQRDASQPAENSRRDVPANVSNPRGRDRQDVDRGPDRQADRQPGRAVPRPPERNANMREGDDRRPTPAIDRADENRGAGNRNAAERQVPRPPERNAGMRDTEDRGRPSTPAVNRSDNAGGGRDRDAAARDVPHPPAPENTPAPGRGQQQAEERPVPRPRSDINVNRDNSPRGNQGAVNVPRPDSRSAETRREAPVVRETNSTPVYRPAAPPRQESRPAEVRREAPAVQRSAPAPERRAEMPRQQSRAPEVRREAPAPQRQAGRSGGGKSGGGKQESHGQGKGQEKGESGKKD